MRCFMCEISKEAIDFWRRSGDIAKVKEKYIACIYSDLVQLDELTGSEFSAEYLSCENNLNDDYLSKLDDKILYFIDYEHFCLDDDEEYSVSLVCESVSSKLLYLIKLIRVEELI